MSNNNLVCGIGATTGPLIATSKPAETSANVWYVDSVTGTDGASPAGQDRKRPLATLGQAITNAADLDIIVMLSTHAETFTAEMLLTTNSYKFIGEGKNAGLPMVKLTLDAAAVNMFSTSVKQEFHNLWFTAPAQATTGKMIDISGGAGSVISECYFECSANNNNSAVDIAANECRVENTTFISTATDSTDSPREGLATNADQLVMSGVVFDGGSYGFSSSGGEPWAFDADSEAILDFTFLGISLLRGADMRIGSGSTGFITVPTCTGGAKVDWQ